MIPYLVCASWIGVFSFVAIIFVHFVTARWKLTLTLAGMAVLASAAVSWVVFDHIITRTCVPTGVALAWLGAAGWAWAQLRSPRPNRP